MPSKKLSLYGELTSRIGSTLPVDYAEPFTAPFYLNGYFETQKSQEDDKKLSFVKRPGFERAAGVLTGLTGLTNNYKIQGVVSGLSMNEIVFYVNNGAANRCYYFNGLLVDNGVAPAASGTWTLSGPVIFTQLDGISYGTTKYAVTDMTKGALIGDLGVWTEITDADFTGLTKATNFCAMDGYLFIGTTNNRIYNSELNTPGTWISTSFLTAADTPGALQWLARLRNYLIAFKQHSIEFFEDTGNPTPGSPLTAQKQLNRKVGLASRSSIKEVSDGIIFLGRSEEGRVEVYKISKDNMEIKSISNQYINQVLGQFTDFDAGYAVDPVVQSQARGEAQVIHYRGKEFYTISVRDVSSNRTYVYDNTLDTWVRWASSITASNVIDDLFTPTQSVQYIQSGNIFNLMVQNTLSSASVPPYFVIMYSGSTNWTDSGSATSTTQRSYPLIWVSDDFDFGTRKRKFMDSLELIYDTYTADAGASGTINLTYRDTNFNSTSPNVAVARTITYSKNNNPSGRAIIRRLGQFRTRNIVLKQTDSTTGYPFRLWGIEVQYNIGETDQET